MRLTRWLLLVACAAPMGASQAQTDSMKAVAPPSPALAGSPTLQAFEARKAKGGGGRFIDEAELRRDSSRSIGDLVGKFAGAKKVQMRGAVHMASSRGTGKVGMTGRMQSRDCFVAVYEQGMQLYRMGGGEAPTDLSQLRVTDYSGLEYYPNYAQIPTDLPNVRQSDCGVLLLWRRER
jgi:hypothetical protein